MQTATSLVLHLLGPFQVFHNKLEAQLVLRRQTRALVAYLAATGQPQPRQALVDMFCEDTADPPRAFRSLLSRTRQRLGVKALLTGEHTVQFNPAAGWVDCLEFARVLQADLVSLSLATLTSTIDLYRGDFLANVSLDGAPEFELWLLNERTSYQQLYERGLGELVTKLIAQGENEMAIVRAQALVQSNPLLEEAHGRLMGLYARSGQREAALAQYEQYRRLLERELAVEPSPELRALRQAIAVGQLASTQPVQTAAIELLSPVQITGHFVGRAAEMAQLQQAWQAAGARRAPASGPSHPLVVLLDAEAGMGKSRLIYEFAAATPQAEFLVGECYESTRALPFAPWLEVLETQLQALDDLALQQLSDFAGDYLARLMPASVRRLRRSKPAAPRRPEGPRPPLGPPIIAGDLNRLFTAISEFLLELTIPRPLLLFMDNLQWADEASIQLFHFLARRSAQGKVLLIGAWRTEEGADAPALQTLVSDLQRRPLFHLHVSPLRLPAIYELTAKLWPGLPVGYRPYVCDLLAKATGGNPLFVTEILRELAQTTTVPSALPVPRSVHELIQRRLNLLPESSRQVIEALAVFDAPATPAQVQQISGRSEGEVITAIDLALRRAFLQPQTETGTAHYGFSHDLVREAVVSQLSHIRRQLLHRRAALTLERAGAKAAKLVHHWKMAGDTEQEGRYAVLAGEEAAVIYANEEAVRYLERALQLIAEPERRTSILCRLGEVWQLLGRQQEAHVVYQQGLALAGTEAHIWGRRAQARCQVALGRLARLRGDYTEAVTWLEKARTIYAALDDQHGLAQALGGLGAIYWSQLDYSRALLCFQQQLDIARRLGDRRGIGGALGSMGVVYTEQGDYAAALACYAQRLQIDQELDDRLNLSKTIGNMGIVYAEQGERLHALACYHSLLRTMLALGDRQNVCVAVGNMIDVYAAEGQYGLAERLAQQAITLGQALNIPLYLCEYLHTSAELLARQGRYAEACPLNAAAIDMAAQIGRTDIQLPAHLLSIRLHMAVDEITLDEAAQTLEALLNAWREDQQQAAILFELWRLDNRRTDYRQRAVELYARLYATTPKIVYRQRHEELAGEALPAPPLLPVPPAVVVDSSFDLETLLAQVDHFIVDLN
jgi:DNA-binding SARP family transcriptional activator